MLSLMGLQVTETEVKQVLTRTSGYLKTITSHSLQPYRGCSYGRPLCGVACHVAHDRWLTRGEPGGSFREYRDRMVEVAERAMPGRVGVSVEASPVVSSRADGRRLSGSGCGV